MIFLDQLKNLKIYKKPLYLPTLENDKKKKSAILLLTPNYESSKGLMTHPLLINRLRYQSYYLPQDVSYYISGRKSKSIVLENYIHNQTHFDLYNNINEMSSAERKTLKDSQFGLPNKRKYPLDIPKHVLSAIKFFNYVSEDEEKELADNINKAITKFNMKDINVGNHNRFIKYFNKIDSVKESFVGEACTNTPETAIVTVSAIIVNEKGEILVLDHKKSAAYNLPGGKIDPNETTKEALIREIEEELGVHITECRPYCINYFACRYPATEDNNNYTYFVDHTFIVDNYEGEIANMEPEKHMDIKWMDRAQLMNDSEIPKSSLLSSYLENWNNINNKDSVINSLNQFIKFSGFRSDIEVIRNIVTPDFYYRLLTDLGLPIIGPQDIPVLNITIDGDDDFKNAIGVETGVITDLWINIPCFKNQYKLDHYIYMIKKTFCNTILSYKYQDTYKETYLCDYLIDVVCNSFGFHKDFGEYIFKSVSRKQYNEILKLKDVNSVYDILSKFKNTIARSDLYKPEAYKSINGSLGTPADGTEIPKEIEVTKYKEDYCDLKTRVNIEEHKDSIDHLQIENVITFFNEDAKYDNELRKLLYNNRIKKRSELIDILDKVKSENEWIKYTYPELSKYKERNVFVDLYYYNQIFFMYNSWKNFKGYELYSQLLFRLINDPELKANGYEYRTVFVPVLDWAHNRNTRMWIYKEDINPVSVLFELMRTNSRFLKDLKGINFVFFSRTSYFKIDFSQIEDMAKASATLRRFVNIMIDNKEFDVDDVDTTFDNKETPRAIKANIIDKIDMNKGVDLTGRVDNLKKKNKEVSSDVNKGVKKNDPIICTNPLDIQFVGHKSNAADIAGDDQKKRESEDVADRLADAIEDYANSAKDTEDAIDLMDKEYIRQLLIDIDNAKDDSVNIDVTRASRMNKLNDKFLQTTIKDVPIRDLLDSKSEDMELPATELKVDSPNEEWKNMKYVNFDKEYNIDKDIVACFYHFTQVSKPVSIRNLSVVDNSTSEDRLDLYTVEMEDFAGKRFTIKLDIPRMEDNRFLLRGNSKALQLQFLNMPIIKTDLDTCQIVSNYQKIFIYRENTITGRSHPTVGKFLKAVEKYKGNKVKFVLGNNTKICNKYELPIDYIDMAGVLDTIETDKIIVYFNQDKLREDYPEVDTIYGIPYGINKETKQLLYFNIEDYGTFANMLMSYINDKEFEELYTTAKPSSTGSFSRCNILNSKIPLAIIVCYMDGMRKVLDKANIRYSLVEKPDAEQRKEMSHYNNYIKFSDGYLIYDPFNYSASMLLNGIKRCSTDIYSITDIDSKSMYLDFLDNFGGRIKSDGLDNFYDCLVDPITKECLEYYKLPTDVVSILLYANNLLCDNKFIKHTDISSRRVRRYELIAAYTYEAISTAYSSYANMIKHGRSGATIILKQSAVIDKILESPVSADDNIINALYAVETTNSITFKGKAGLNDARSYSLDKRTYDKSMLNSIGMSTNFSANVGITRQTTMDMNVQGVRGFIKTSEFDPDKMNAAKTLCATEALTPFGSTRDDSQRTYMTFIQTAKHMLRTEDSDPLLVTNGADQALPYLTIDKYAFKAKYDGVIKEITDEYIIVEYQDGRKDYINLTETIEKNSDGGFYVPLKLDKAEGLKVGSKVKTNDILAYDKKSFSNNLGESDNLAYNIGKLVKVAVINTDDGFEDSGICTDNLSRKLASRIVRKVEHTIDKDATVLKMLKVGDHVEVDDSLIVWQDPHDDEEADTLTRILNNDSELVSELGRKTMKSTLSGDIVDIKIYRTVEIEDLSPSLQNIVKEYEAPIKKLKKKLDSEGINSKGLPATYKLEPTGKLKRAQQAIYIEFYLEYLDTVAVGDKITYYSANKATIKNVIPKKLTPYTDFRPNEPIDAFVSVTSIDKRMVTSTINIGSIQKLMVELDRTIKDKLGIKYDDSTV